jgi:rhodanese-related sulfurtransferase
MNPSPSIITPTELRTFLAEGKDIELVDVRILEKHQAFNIGGKHIPLEEMPARSHELAKDKLIVTYCTSGNRSMRALEYLQSLGFNHIQSLAGGMTAWQAMLAS